MKCKMGASLFPTFYEKNILALFFSFNNKILLNLESLRSTELKKHADKEKEPYRDLLSLKQGMAGCQNGRKWRRGWYW